MGMIEANGGALAIASAIDPTSNGVFRLDASSLLEIAADQGANDKMSFVGSGGELVVDAAQKFGLNVGSTRRHWGAARSTLQVMGAGMYC